ncbi:hypothetical protein HRbin17_00828 [bacterium HR17]|uniref:MucB/RseB N-terminal domain-containing protein n=1 Tax=Candidatus Fervidibacter japonicus TaxID=2035412 RepID=A0A2H5XAV8_9BACT|nr:hypothetical protein HRbin17_00828 [bacterium HR17]
MRQFWLLSLLVLLCTNPEALGAEDIVHDIVKTAILRESSIKTGKVILHVFKPGNPQKYQEVIYIFDNQNKKIFEESKKIGHNQTIIPQSEFRILLTPKISMMTYYSLGKLQVFRDFRDFRDYPSSYHEGWEKKLLRGRFWDFFRKEDLLRSKAKLKGNYIILLLPPGKRYREIIWLDQKKYLPVKLQVINRDTNKVELQGEIFYQMYQEIWYPKQVVYLGRATYIVKKVDLNIQLTDKDFRIDDIPVGAFVQDNRFNPPLVYRQGYRQFTDEELFQMAKNRELLEDPKWMGYEMPTGKATLLGYLIAGIGLLLTVISIYMARRVYRKRMS